MSFSHIRPDVLHEGPLHYAPENELGVVFLFANLAKRWRLRLDAIQSGYPDCIAYQKVQRGEKRIRIEFEYRSRNFAQHRHNSRKCDWIVCWKHDWPKIPKRLRVIELRREFGLGFNVWIAPVRSPAKEKLEQARLLYDKWTTPSQANKGDLLLLYSTNPQKYIAHVLLLKERPSWGKAKYKPVFDYLAPVRRLCWLNAPVFLQDLQRHPILSTAGFVRGYMQARHNVTEYWPVLYEMIVRRNPSRKPILRRYAPQML